jgi:hypothetical protein
MKYVYLIQGRTGEYEDRIEWIYKAFVHENEARDVASYLTDWLIGNNCYMGSYVSQIKHWDIVKKMREEIDPQGQMDYTGVEYTVLKVELME